MRQIRRLAALAVLCLALSACFMSRTPLIPPDEAAFPFEHLTLKGADDDIQEIVRAGDAYRFGPPDEAGRYALLRLVPAGDDGYVVALWPPDEADADETGVLYGFLVVDRAAGVIASYAATKPRDFTPLPGLAACESHVCVEDLDAYAAYARGRIAAGAAPDQTYRIVSIR